MKLTRMAATAALLGLPTLHVMTEAEAQAGVYRLLCTQQWRPESTNFGHTKKSQDMKHKPILQMGSDRILLRYAYHKLFMVNFPDTCAWQNGFNPDKNWAWAGTRESKTNRGTGAGMYRLGSRQKLLQSWARTMVFQAEIYAIKAYIMDSREKGYTVRNNYTLSNSRNHQGP